MPKALKVTKSELQEARDSLERCYKENTNEKELCGAEFSLFQRLLLEYADLKEWQSYDSD